MILCDGFSFLIYRKKKKNCSLRNLLHSKTGAVALNRSTHRKSTGSPVFLNYSKVINRDETSP